MGITLITWSCGHFVMKPAPIERPAAELIDSARNDFWFLEETCDQDLANVPTERHVPSTSRCPKCIDPENLVALHSRAQKAIGILRSHYRSSKVLYLELGARYHRLDFSQKAGLADDPRCASAHEQFWISKTPYKQDRFFAPMLNALDLCNKARSLFEATKTEEAIKEAFEAINEARAQVGKMVMPLDNLVTAIELMATAPIKFRNSTLDRPWMMSSEYMISVPKAISFWQRLGDWQDEAKEIFVRMMWSP